MLAGAVHGGKPGIAEPNVGEHDGARNIGGQALGIADELTAFPVAEYLEVEVRRLLSLATYSADECQRRHDRRPRLPRRISQNQLPRHAVTILDPAVPLTERVRVQRHQHRPVSGELRPDLVE